MHQPEWITLQDAIRLWEVSFKRWQTEFPTNGPEAINLSDEQNKAFTEAIASGVFRAQGVRLDGSVGAEGADLTEIPPVYFRQRRTFQENTNRIESWNPSLSNEQFDDSRKNRVRHPDWTHVLFRRAEFMAWLDSEFPAANLHEPDLPGLPQLSDDEARKAYRAYLRSYPSNKLPPSWKDDYDYLNTKGRISQTQVKKIRSELAPHHWKEGGTNKKYRPNPSARGEKSKKTK